MTNNLDLKYALRDALQDFHKMPLAKAAIALFKTLGYRSDKRIELHPNTAEQFRVEFDSQKQLNSEKALIKSWSSVDVLFQITDEEIREALGEQRSMFASGKFDGSIINSYLFFAIGLQEREKPYTRTELATITREVNKLFKMPVMILFQHGETISIAIIRRRLNISDESRDVLEKVTLIKDIRFSENRPHIEILLDLAISQLAKENKIANFLDLQKAWEKTLNIDELNKKFYKDLANWYFWAIKKVTFPMDAGKDEITRNSTSVIRLITRLIFVWFIKEKGLIPEELFDENYLDRLLNYSNPKGSTFYKAILQNLFFATLNIPMKDRRFRSEHTYQGKNKDFGNDYVFRYQSLFKEKVDFEALFLNIPFLNGGLFECLDNREKSIHIDGFSDREDNPLKVPDELFFGDEHEVDLNEIYDTRNKSYKVRGLIHILKSYKFTVEENTPIEEEVALDPELLGKVFENLLASYNPETDVTARKQTGSFYTPREIVDYMVDDALINFLESQLPPSENIRGNLRDLFAYNEKELYFTDSEKTRLIDEIQNIKVLDPACGSGAFPMGVLHKLVHALEKLDPGNHLWEKRQLSKANEIEDLAARETAVNSIKKVFGQHSNSYGRKLYLIEHCIYGVDIQPIAVQISKLRFFISLIVDQKIDRNLDNMGIHSLPNLETKITAANSLISVNRSLHDTETEKSENRKIDPDVINRSRLLVDTLRQYLNVRNPDLKKKYLDQGRQIALEINVALANNSTYIPVNVDWIFPNASSVEILKNQLPLEKTKKAMDQVLKSDTITQLEHELEKVRHAHFFPPQPQDKYIYQDRDAQLRSQLVKAYKQIGMADKDTMLLLEWDPYDHNATAGFFDTKWMFTLPDGFDIVIGNPPYLRVQGIQKTQSEFMDYYRNNFESATGSFDLYALFIEKGYKLLNKNGQLAYIVPHKFLQASFGIGLRRMLTERQALRQLVRFGYEQIFEESTTYTCLLFLTNRPNRNFDLIEIKSLERGEEVLRFVQAREEHPDYAYDILPEPSLSENNIDLEVDWDFAIGEKNRVLRRLQQHPKRLDNIIRKMFQGIPTGLDKVFVLELLHEKPNTVICYSHALNIEVEIEKEFVKPFLMGKDVHRYEKPINKNVVLFPYTVANGSPSLMLQSYIAKKYPKAWSYLKKNEFDLKARENERFLDSWHCYSRPQNLSEFETIKLMTPEIANCPQMTIDSDGVLFHTTKVYSFAFKYPEKISLKFMLGVMNSKVLWFFLTSTGYVLRGGYYTFKTEYLKPFPIAESTPMQESTIATLVDYILAIKALPEAPNRQNEVDRRLMVAYFEQLIDGLVYELYFPEEFSDAGKSLYPLLNSTEIPALKELHGETESALQSLFHRLYESDHPVRKMIYFLDTIEAVRVIEERTKGK